MRILVAGASGVLGRAVLRHLDGHEVAGLTRSAEKLEPLGNLGADPILCDVYDYGRLLRVTQRFRPDVVANFLSALSSGPGEENNRVRREGGRNVLEAAKSVAAGRLVVESVAFALGGDAAEAVAELELSARQFPGEWVILRFGRLWGPGTYYERQPREPTIHIERAGTRAAGHLFHAASGTYSLIDER